MRVKLTREDLAYEYRWVRDRGDEPYTGVYDDRMIDKDDGYEVMPFLERILNDLELDKSFTRHAEETLHLPQLSDVVQRNELYAYLEIHLRVFQRLSER